MKKEKGITLVALLLYIMMFSATLAILSTMTSYIYGNLKKIDESTISSEEFNKFNVNFVKDVKESKNFSIDTSDNTRIVISFDRGATYTYVKGEKSIYKNKVKIAKDIYAFSAEKVQNKDTNDKLCIKINISIGKDSKSIQYTDEITYVLKYW